MRDGTISCSEFYAAASAFSEQWTKLNYSSLPRWSWVPSPKRPWSSNDNRAGYLSLENVILPRLSEGNGDAVEKQECSSECEDEDEDDPALLVHTQGPGEHRYDFHVVYSASYRVPVLYFRAYCNDGQSVCLDDIVKDIPVDSAQLLTASKWTFMTQEEHPVLNRPWYTLHPCGTSEWMKLLDAPHLKYMLSWFSVVGQLFGLKIPLHMLSSINLDL